MKVRCPKNVADSTGGIALTKGKVYDAFDVCHEGRTSFSLIDDVGREIFCLLEKCCFLDKADWEVVNEHEYSGETEFKFVKEEADPNGRSANEAGSKLDAGKTRVGLVVGDFPRAILAVSEIGTFGANKYTPRGWLEVPNALERYDDAMMRHYFREKAGELIDPDSELMHHAHFAWNALATLELKLKQMEEENGGDIQSS